MNTSRRIGAVSCALFGGFLVFSAITGTLERRGAMREKEFLDYYPILLTRWVGICLVGLALLFAARRMWKPRSNTHKRVRTPNPT